MALTQRRGRSMSPDIRSFEIFKKAKKDKKDKKKKNKSKSKEQ